jgi:hypothetical protein
MNFEDLLQQKCVTWFKNEYQMHGKGLIFSVPNGGFRNAVEAKKLKATGVMAGVSDLIVLFPNKAYFIELKDGNKGFQSESQMLFESKVKELGFEYYLVRNFDQFTDLCKTL